MRTPPARGGISSGPTPLNHARSERDLSRTTSFSGGGGSPMNRYFEPRVSQHQRSEAEILRSVSRRFSSLSVQDLQYQHPPRGLGTSSSQFYPGGPVSGKQQSSRPQRRSETSQHGSAAYAKQHRAYKVQQQASRRYSSTSLASMTGMGASPVFLDRTAAHTSTNSLSRLTPYSVVSARVD